MITQYILVETKKKNIEVNILKETQTHSVHTRSNNTVARAQRAQPHVLGSNPTHAE